METFFNAIRKKKYGGLYSESLQESTFLCEHSLIYNIEYAIINLILKSCIRQQEHGQYFLFYSDIPVLHHSTKRSKTMVISVNFEQRERLCTSDVESAVEE